MDHQSLEELYIDQLQDLYDSERAIAKKLPILVQEASSPELRRVFEYCLEQTEENACHTAQILSRSRHSPDPPCEHPNFGAVKLRLVPGGSRR
jgi:ferritin-like metal-binding protein YciE